MLWEGGPFRLALPISGKSSAHHTYSLQFSPSKTVREVTDEVKTFMCAAALDFCRGNKKEAAKLIDISRDSFYRYIKRISKKSRFETP
jgi:DNA-binding NtrC family response regulator